MAGQTDNPFFLAAIGISMGGDCQGGLDTAVAMSRKEAEGSIPEGRDCRGFREAIEAWGIEIIGEGKILKLIGSESTLKVRLPEGWVAKGHGGGGHNGLFDADGHQRMRWHIHGWEPVSGSVIPRYKVRLLETGPEHGIVQVLDRGGAIKSFPVAYPHSRDDINHYEHYSVYYLTFPDDMPVEVRQGMDRANRDVQCAAEAEARKWLDDNRPGWQDAAKSWLIEGPAG